MPFGDTPSAAARDEDSDVSGMCETGSVSTLFMARLRAKDRISARGGDKILMRNESTPSTVECSDGWEFGAVGDGGSSTASESFRMDVPGDRSFVESTTSDDRLVVLDAWKV